MRAPEERLKELILDSGLVSRKDVDAAAEAARSRGKLLGDILVIEGKLAEADYRRMEAYALGIPYVDLTQERIAPDTLAIIPEPIARKHTIVAYRKTAKELEVAMLDPQDLESIEFIKKKVGLKILPRLTDAESMKAVLLQYQKNLKAEFGDIIKDQAAAIEGLKGSAEGEEGLKKLAEGLPVVRIVDTLLSHAIVQKASDVHIEPSETGLLIRYRIDGILHDAMVLPPHAAPGIIARIKVLANLRLDEKRLPQDGRFKISAGEELPESVSFRVSVLPTFYGEKVVMRLLVETSRGYTLEGLGFHGRAVEMLHGALRKTTGLVLTTGPTGSGKTTTLYTLLDMLNTPEVNISTVEDPIEYQIPRINQTQVRPEIGLSFANGLRALVRQDPDIIMVGEIRDEETAGLAINAALTGHLVLSTLHTNSAAGAVPRMIEMGAEPFLLVSTLRVVVAQRLVRRLCKRKEEYHLSEDELRRLSDNMDLDRVLAELKSEQVVPANAKWKDVSFYKPIEGDVCPDGYSGRITIAEVMPFSSAVAELVLRSAPEADIEKEARKEGMLTILENGLFKAAEGVTSMEEVLRVANE